MILTTGIPATLVVGDESAGVIDLFLFYLTTLLKRFGFWIG